MSPCAQHAAFLITNCDTATLMSLSVQCDITLFFKQTPCRSFGWRIRPFWATFYFEKSSQDLSSRTRYWRRAKQYWYLVAAVSRSATLPVTSLVLRWAQQDHHASLSLPFYFQVEKYSITLESRYQLTKTILLFLYRTPSSMSRTVSSSCRRNQVWTLVDHTVEYSIHAQTCICYAQIVIVREPRNISSRTGCPMFESCQYLEIVQPL